MCIGDEFAKMLLIIFTSTILLEYSLSLPKMCEAKSKISSNNLKDNKDIKLEKSSKPDFGKKHICSNKCFIDPSLDPEIGFTLAPKKFNLILTKRV